MESPYTNREILEKWNDVKQSLLRIENQTIQHNHRMTKMEAWRQWITGAMAVLGMFVVPFLGWMAYKVSMIDAAVQAAVSQALLPYVQ